MYNIIPSISAITGISPQRYLWRISIAIHIGPRFLITFAYRNYYRQRLAEVAATLDAARISAAKRLIAITTWLSLTEVSALLGVTYISNRENYRELLFDGSVGSSSSKFFSLQQFTKRFSLFLWFRHWFICC